jgi:hypothetical protein
MAKVAEASRGAAFDELERLGTARAARAKEALRGIRARSAPPAGPQATGDEIVAPEIARGASMGTAEDDLQDWKRHGDHDSAGETETGSESDTEELRSAGSTDPSQTMQDDFEELEVGEDDGTLFHYSPPGEKRLAVTAASGLLMRPQSAPAVVPRLARQQQEEEQRNRAFARERPSSAHRFRVVASANSAVAADSVNSPAAESTANLSGGTTQNFVQIGDVIEAIDSQLPLAVEPALLQWLSKLRLLRYAPAVASLCTSLDDVAQMNEREIKGLKLKPLEELRMTKAVKALRE